MNVARRVSSAALLVFASSIIAAAQPVPPGNPWSHGTTIDAFAGMASASSNRGPLAGGAAGWEITPWFGLDGSAAWLDRSGTAEAFTAALTARANLRGGRTAVPFIKGGIGLYRASFDSSPDVLPDFYRRRLGAGGSALATSFTFTDPSFVIGGGVDVFRTRHIALHPEIQATVVTRQSRTYVVTTVTMHVAYHFEDHPITPARERR